MKTKLSAILFVLLLAAPGLLEAAVLDVPGSFATIQAGIDAAAEGDTVLVAPGTYYENLNLTGKSITLASHYITTGDTMYMHETVIDGNQKAACLHIESGDERISPTVIGFTIQNANFIPTEDDGSGIRCLDADPRFECLLVKNNKSDGGGGGILCLRSNPVLKYIYLIGNTAVSSGGGIRFFESNPVLDNIYVYNNSSPKGGGVMIGTCYSAILKNCVISDNAREGVVCQIANATFINTEISNNNGEIMSCSSSYITFVNSTLVSFLYSIQGMSVSKSTILFTNSIVWTEKNNTQIEILNNANATTSKIIFKNSILRGGVERIIGYHEDLPLNTDVFFSDDSMTQSPLFIDPYNSNFRLKENSPCIDAGTAYFEWDGKVIVDLEKNTYGGSAPDIGAYETDKPTGVEKEKKVMPAVMLLSPYPNPFNSVVSIPYCLIYGSQVTLSIYNNAGQKVIELANGFHASGTYSVSWNASGYASGQYYCCLKINKTLQKKKMLYLK